MDLGSKFLYQVDFSLILGQFSIQINYCPTNSKALAQQSPQPSAPPERNGRRQVTPACISRAASHFPL